jgi:predicted nucleotidyltransferase
MQPTDHGTIGNQEILETIRLHLPSRDLRHLIYLGYAGSIAHGTSMRSRSEDAIDDIDLVGVMLPPMESVIGLETWRTLRIDEHPLDIVIYPLPQFVQLVLKSNPNMLSLLWTPTKHIIWQKLPFAVFAYCRRHFLSKKIYHAIKGYAHGQADEIEKSVFRGHMGEKRKELVERFGYDTKAASHTIRLLSQGIEALHTGHIRVDRTNLDAEYLMSVKAGKHSKEDVLSMIGVLFGSLDYTFKYCSLPEEPDRNLAQQLLMEQMKSYIDSYQITPDSIAAIPDRSITEYALAHWGSISAAIADISPAENSRVSHFGGYHADLENRRT